MLGNEEIDFLVDTGAAYSVINTGKGKLSQENAVIVGATGKRKRRPFFQPLDFNIGKQRVFIYVREPCPLAGKRPPHKVRAQITFVKYLNLNL